MIICDEFTYFTAFNHKDYNKKQADIGATEPNRKSELKVWPLTWPEMHKRLWLAEHLRCVQ